jgi:ferrous iron transport protein B
MKTPKIALVGQPNAGKSTVFNVLSDIKTSSSNFSGTSVEVTGNDISIRGSVFHIIDLPGVYSLNPGDEAERVTLAYLLNEDVDLIINVVDASLLSRSLELTVELIEFGIPMVIALNMWDEAERKGLKIYPKKLEKSLNIPVVTTSALYGKGVKNLVDKCYDIFTNGRVVPNKIEYTSHVEQSVATLENILSDNYEKVDRDASGKIEQRKGGGIKGSGSYRFYAIKAIENPELVPEEMMALISGELHTIREQITELHKKDGYETISYERHHICMKLAEDISHFIDRKEVPLREKIDRYFLHPILGYFPLLFFFFIFFIVIYFTGNLLSTIINIPLDKLPLLYEGLRISSPFLWFTVDGVFQGISGAIGIVLPYFLPLIFLTAIFEDTGYLARIAFLLDGIMHKMGLHGKSVAPFILGFGCSVPALYGTRIIENKRDRMLTALLIPFIPCSARTTVIFALTIAFTGPFWALFVYFITALVVGAAGKLLSLFIGKPTGLILEIPDLKIPSLRSSFSKSWLRVKDFLRFALPFLIAGSIVMGWLEYAAITDSINKVFAPALNGLLGLPQELGSTLIFGFFRKELIIVMATSAMGVHSIAELPLSPEQIIVFVIFVTLYFPCFATFIVMLKEFGKKIVLVSTILSISFALLAAYLVKIILI